MKSFLDNLDSGWGDIIADTYKEHAVKPFIKTNDIKITIDDSTKVNQETFNNTLYKVRYTDLLNSNYKIDISISKQAYIKLHELALEINVLDTSVNKYVLVLEMISGNVHSQYFKLAKEDPDNALKELMIEEKPFLNWDIIFSMIDENINVSTLDKNNLKEFIKAKTLDIK